ncbi:DUF1080 domain-containing protein [Micromonospora sp. CPCC 205371]|nr:DUF1080 domain-containing protein [Micromonospora sp. CPCC 205371]
MTAAPVGATASRQAPAQADQVLTWTAGDSFTSYVSAPTTAVAGAATLVFENSAATGNTTGMQHTLTFDTGDPRYNRDVDVNILADPFDTNGGRWTVDVVLTPGTYRYFCAIPGHGQMAGLLTVTGSGPDTTPPAVTASVSGERDEVGAYVGAATVTLAATDAQSGVDSVEYALDGAAYTAYGGPVTVTALGQHTVSYRATDNAGNTSAPQSVTFTVVEPPDPDTTPPTVTASVSGERDGSGAYVGTATVTLSAADTESGVDTVEYSLDGQPYATYTTPVAVNQPGAHTVSYRATDNAGNASAPQSVSFTVVDDTEPDTSPPTVTGSVSGERDGSGAYVGAATVTLVATDAESGVDRVEYSFDGGAYLTYTGPLTVTDPGQHAVAYRATDRAGNASAVQSLSFTVVAGGPDPECPVTDTRATVWLGTVDSGVPNRVVRAGCTINNLTGDARTWTNHGQFVRHVTDLAEHLHHLGVISHAEHGALVDAAGRSGVGKPDGRNGYQALLDRSGASFALWEHVGAGGFSRNADGSITGRPVDGLGVLWFPVRQYGDFSLKLQWRAEVDGAVYVRFPHVHNHPDESRPEWVPVRYGHRVELSGAGDAWVDYEIRATGPHYSVFRDGVLVREHHGGQHATGYIGLQTPGAAGTGSFRTIRIAPLTL